MDANQKREIELQFRRLSHGMFRAWSYLHHLKGLHLASKKYPEILGPFSRIFEEMYRAAFDALTVSTGTLLDRNASTSSLPTLVKKVRSICLASAGPAEFMEARYYADLLEQYLNEKTGPIGKLERWRHNAVAHRNAAVSDDEEFYSENKLHLDEVESALGDLDKLFNALSISVHSIYNDTRSGSLDLLVQADSLCDALAQQLQQDKKVVGD